MATDIETVGKMKSTKDERERQARRLRQLARLYARNRQQAARLAAWALVIRSIIRQYHQVFTSDARDEGVALPPAYPPHRGNCAGVHVCAWLTQTARWLATRIRRDAGKQNHHGTRLHAALHSAPPHGATDDRGWRAGYRYLRRAAACGARASRTSPSRSAQNRKTIM